MSLYVHFPWCVRKCPYCDFNSHPLDGEVPEARYVDRLLEDLQCDIEWTGERPVQTIFLGGGTPSLFSPDAIARLLGGVNQLTALSPDAEITLEANPGAVDRAHFIGYRAAGVNRLSLGAQSFQPRMLEALGRIHNPGDTVAAAEAAQAAGFLQVNLDVMHGLPHQTVADSRSDLARAIDLAPTHLSWYQLTLEPKTPFAARPPPLPGEQALADIEAAGLEQLADAGYQRYEVSAYARAGAQAHHNLNYWQFGDYLGIGAGAHGKVTFAARGEIVRSTKPLQPRRYLADPPTTLRSVAAVAPEARPGEFMMNALRLLEGVSEGLFESRTGTPIEKISAPRRRMIELGLMADDRLAVTPFGLTHLDTIVGAFL